MDVEKSKYVVQQDVDGVDEYISDECTSGEPSKEGSSDEEAESLMGESSDGHEDGTSTSHHSSSLGDERIHAKNTEVGATLSDSNRIQVENDGSMAPPSLAELLNREFSSYEDAYKLYVRYAKSVGFGVRRGDVGRNSRGQVTRRTFVCCKEGLRHEKHYRRVDRKRGPKPETRTNCMARLLVYMKKGSSTWKVRKCVSEHNHELTPQRFVQLISNHRRMTEAHKAQIDMHQFGMQTTHIMGFMAEPSGEYRSVGFGRGKIADGDAAEAISYLEGRADVDGMTAARYTITEQDKLGNLFWADGPSRVDYQYFGDVVAFDSTYKKNKYNKPLVIFSGVNHHKQSAVFGFALIADERIDTYQWLLEQFLDVMGGKVPKVVVTDGDDGMREAIRRVFPGVTHRLCAWHLHKNAISNIKEEEFCEAFKRCMYSNCSPDEFEQMWQDALSRFHIEDNGWVASVYAKKEMWATTYLRDKFCAGFKTTSLCEGINSVVKRFIKSWYTIYDLVKGLERVLKGYRNNELEAQFKSIYTTPVFSTGLRSIEEGAAKSFTYAIFVEVKQQIEDVLSLVFVSRERFGTAVKYQLCKFGHPNKVISVLCDKAGNNDGPKILCDCHFWSMNGIPCCHMIYVMKDEHIPVLPQSLVMKRWRKDAKTFDEKDHEMDSSAVQVLRYGALCAASNWISFLASKSSPHFRQTMDSIHGITNVLEGRMSVPLAERGGPTQKIGDPIVSETKGAPKVRKCGGLKRVCSNCSLYDHNKSSCPKVDGHPPLSTEDEWSGGPGPYSMESDFQKWKNQSF